MKPNKRDTLRWVAGEKTPPKTYITRVFNFGTWEEWQAMKRDFSQEMIRETILHPLRGQWTSRGKAFAETLFDCKMPKHVLISYHLIKEDIRGFSDADSRIRARRRK